MTSFVPPTSLHTPVLFLVFNRPDTTATVFEMIRQAKPLKLYIAADGPRPGVQSDKMKCEQVKQIVHDVDWPCEVTTLYRTENLGCGIAISTAITWFFDHEPEGIILEDDCLPSLSFFWYCQELLNKYRDDTRVMHIGGNNFLNGFSNDLEYSYYFARNGHIWGWATWRRAWKHYDLAMKNYPNTRNNRFFENFFINPLEKFYRLRKLDQVYQHKIDTWDYQWDFARYSNSGLSIVPNKNLVHNLGFGENATHTRGRDSKYAKLSRYDIAFPLRHPPLVLRNIASEKKYFSILMKDVMISKLTLS